MLFDPRDVVPIPVERFLSGLKTDVDVFIQLSDQNFVLLTKAGEAFELTQLKRYQNRRVSNLYVRKSDYPLFIKQQVAVAGILLKNEKIEVSRRSTILSSVAESVYHDLEMSGLSTNNFYFAKELSNNVIQLVERHDDLGDLLVGLNEVWDEYTRHSIAVAFVSALIAKQMKWERRETLEKLVLGALLHDIGKKELSPELLKKRRLDMNYNEIREYETHAYRGMMILQSIPGIPEEIVAVAYEHHENAIGQGFPRKLWDVKIHPLARVVGVANTFCNLILSSASNPDPKFADHAVYHMQNIMGKPYSKDVFVALVNIVDKKDKKIA